jgi:hypothetical protein
MTRPDRLSLKTGVRPGRGGPRTMPPICARIELLLVFRRWFINLRIQSVRVHP